MLTQTSILFLILLGLQVVVAPPVDQKKKEKDDKKEKTEELDDFVRYSSSISSLTLCIPFYFII